MDPEILICHTGTNNLDFSDSYSVADSFTDFANIAKEKFPSSKVVISSILPRDDSIQNKVELCNCILERELQSLDIEVLSHQNVENKPDALYDNKHLNKYHGLPIFTQNLRHVIQIYSFSSPGDFRRRRGTSFFGIKSPQLERSRAVPIKSPQFDRSRAVPISGAQNNEDNDGIRRFLQKLLQEL